MLLHARVAGLVAALLLAESEALAVGLSPAHAPLLRSACPTVRAAPRLSAGGGGGRGGVISADGDGDGDGDGEERDETEVAAALAKSGVSADSLPADVYEALRAGRIGAAELTNWAAVLSNPLTKLLALSSYIRCRLLASPTLPTVLGIEIGVGCLSTLAAEKAARGKRFMDELDFVVANQALIVLTNIALVLALTPAAAVALPPAAGTLAAWSAGLPGYFLQAGEYSAGARAACFFSKAAQFAVVGSVTSAAGQAMTVGLVKARTRLDPKNAPKVELASPLSTSAAYAAFMAASSNTRYQVVNSFEGNLLPLLPGGAAARTAGSLVLRTANNYAGSSNWIWWARYNGLQ